MERNNRKKMLSQNKSKQKNARVINIDEFKNKSTEKVGSVSKRLKYTMLFFFVLLFLLILRLGWLQIVKGATLKEAMYNQLTTSRLISPKRGTIYDSTGKALARSAQVDTVSIDSTKIVVKSSDAEVASIKTKALKEKVAKAFSEIFELDYEETLKKVSSESKSTQTIARKQEKDKIDKLRAWMKENDVYSGINIDEDTRRYYPYNNLASNLIGFCGTDNQGLEGLEAKWDSVLTGTPGKIVSSQDAVQDLIPDENQTYIAVQNGNDITLTIDANIQGIAEKYLKQACDENKCEEGGNVIIMSPSTGDILAMATYPDYNLNTPFTPTYITTEEWNKLSSSDQSNQLQSIWNNRAITSTYEPGSVFKIITAAVGLEENIVTSDKAGTFDCIGYQKVAGTKIYCSNTTGHGKQSLRNALENSCNPAFMQLGKKIGATTLYRYYNAFGFFDTTNFASAGERSGYFWDLNDVGEVELATMSFGQRFRVTPLQMITAVSAVANNGVLMQPRIVKSITNTDTGAVTTVDSTKVRQVISEETADKLIDMLESVVTDGTGKYAQVKGYSIAGKTGTSEVDTVKNKNYIASFVAIAPTESPEVVVLVTLNKPRGANRSGSKIAAPVAAQILKEVLPYMEIPSDTIENSNNSETKELPSVVNKTVAEAKKQMKKLGFNCKTSGNDDEIVTEQMPRAGTALVSNATVMLYTKGKDTRVSQIVPDLKGMTITEAKSALKKKNLNIKINGSGYVTSQEIPSGTSVEEGTVISVTMQKKVKE